MSHSDKAAHGWAVCANRPSPLCHVDPEPVQERAAVRPIVLSVSKDPEAWRYRNTVLVGLGVGVCPASSVRAALARIDRLRIAVVVLGQSIAEADKLEFIRQCKSARDVPIICISSGNKCFCSADSCIAEADVAGLVGAVANYLQHM